MGTIKIRYKHGALPGDPAAFNAHGAPNGFPRVVFGGDEHDIPDTELDDKDTFIIYRYKDGKEKPMTEKEYRKTLYETGGYRGPQYNEAAPAGRNENNKNLVLLPRKMNQAETIEFLNKQKAATLKFKFFNPMCMELISTLPGDTSSEKDDKAQDRKTPDIAKMSVKDALAYIGEVKDENELTGVSIAEDRGQARPAVLMGIENQLKKIRGA